MVGDHGMHQLVRTDDGVDRAGVETFPATDATRFIDKRAAARMSRTDRGIEPFRWYTEQLRQTVNGGVAAGRATVDVGFAARDGFRVVAAAGIAASGALSLWQPSVDAVDDFRNPFGRRHAPSIAGSFRMGNLRPRHATISGRNLKDAPVSESA